MKCLFLIVYYGGTSYHYPKAESSHKSVLHKMPLKSNPYDMLNKPPQSHDTIIIFLNSTSVSEKKMYVLKNDFIRTIRTKLQESNKISMLKVRVLD